MSRPSRRTPLTAEQIERAQANGINYDMLYNRYHRSNWDAERALTEAPHANVGPGSNIDDTPRLIKQEEGMAPLEVVAKKYNVEPSFVKDVWTYYC